MGYTTDFYGEFDVSPVLTPKHYAYLTAFAGTRRMKRNAALTAALPDPLREAVGLPVGPEGAFYVDAAATSYRGQSTTADVVDSNNPPADQPGLWCQWVPGFGGAGIEWDGGEKFYRYVEWITYLIDTFLKPWGYTVKGEVEWQGEDREDRGKIVVENNEVIERSGRMVYE